MVERMAKRRGVGVTTPQKPPLETPPPVASRLQQQVIRPLPNHRQQHQQQQQQAVSSHLQPFEHRAHSNGSPHSPIVTPKQPPSRGKATNLPRIRNAILHVLLCGPVNAREQIEALSVLTARGTHHQYMILFKGDKSRAYRGLYVLVSGAFPEDDVLVKAAGNGPSEIVPALVQTFYKYDSGAKTFAPLPTREVTLSTDAVSLPVKASKRVMYDV